MCIICTMYNVQCLECVYYANVYVYKCIVSVRVRVRVRVHVCVCTVYVQRMYSVYVHLSPTSY